MIYTYYVEPTNACNLRCPTCASNCSPRPKGMMDFGLFQKAVQQRPGDSVCLYYGGEPLLHPDIDRMVYFIKSQGAACRLVTNGQLLTETMCKRLVGQLDLISVSLDTVNPLEYQQHRTGADVRVVLENMKRLRDLRESRQAKLPEIHVELIDFPGGSMRRNWNSTCEALRGIADRVRAKRFLHYPLLTPQAIAPTMSCYQVTTSLAVLWNGEVTPCCVDLGGQCVVGDLRTQSVGQILASETYRSVIALAREGSHRVSRLCHCCQSITALNGNPYLAELDVRLPPALQ